MLWWDIEYGPVRYGQLSGLHMWAQLLDWRLWWSLLVWSVAFFSQSLCHFLFILHNMTTPLHWKPFFPLMGHGLDSHFLSLFCLSLSLDQKLQWLRPHVQLMNDSFFNCLEIGMDAFILSFRAKINRDDRVFFACWSTQAGKIWSWITCKEIKYTIIGRDLCGSTIVHVCTKK